MSQQQTPPRPDQIAAARHCREMGGSWMDCIALTGLSSHVLRCEIEPGHRESEQAKSKARRERQAKDRAPKPPRADCAPIVKPKAPRASRATGHSAASVMVPQDVLFERDRAILAPRSLTATLLGDPPAGRSALDKRGA